MSDLLFITAAALFILALLAFLGWAGSQPEPDYCHVTALRYSANCAMWWH